MNSPRQIYVPLLDRNSVQIHTAKQVNRSILINGQCRFQLLCVHIANKKFKKTFVRISTKSHIPGFHVRKSSCRLENYRAYICAVCDSTLNRICLMLHDVINFNDNTSAISSYEYGRNITFTGV